MLATSPALRRSVIVMRVLCPLMVGVCIVNGLWAYSLCHPVMFAFNTFLAGINLMLTWIEWAFFKI